MAATVSGAKTVTTDISPGITASLLTSLLAIAPENLTLAQLRILSHAIEHTPLGTNPANTLGQVLI